MSPKLRDTGSQPAYVAEPDDGGGSVIRVDFGGTWHKARRIAEEYVAIIGLKRVAGDCGMTAATLKHCLSERNRHHLPARVLIYLLANPPDDRLSKLLAATAGGTWEKRRKRTEEECWRVAKERLVRQFGEKGAEVVEEIEHG